MKKRGFLPTEIIFAVTTACNLHCEHCFVNRKPVTLSVADAKKFLLTCKNTSIEKIGFTGGEPFLNLNFICEISKFAVQNDFLFDQIITNGDWWKNEAELKEKFQQLYDSGYDGKIAVSWDSYHGQSEERMMIFIRTAQEFFGENALNIQTVNEEGESLPLAPASKLSSATPSSGEYPATPPVYNLQRSFPSDDARAWQYKKWFKEDYCEGPGHILYVHADGNIAPCCGFANENQTLFIGNINQDLETILQNASSNKMVKICYEEGLSHFRRHGLKKILKAKGIKLPKGKCGDICSFCDFVCKSL